MTPNLLDELARIALLARRDTPSFRDRSDCLHFLRTHAPTLADMAKWLEAAERLRDAIQAQIDHAEINDSRLPPDFGKSKGEAAVRVRYLRAAIDATQEGAAG